MVTVREHVCFYSITKALCSDDVRMDVMSTTTSGDTDNKAIVNDLKIKYRSVLKYVKTLPSSHNWLKYIKEKVNQWWIVIAVVVLWLFVNSCDV